MNTRSLTQNQTQSTPDFAPVQTGILQRKCACGNSAAGLTGKCSECEGKRLTLQKKAAGNEKETAEVPPIVHEVLRSPVAQIQPKLKIGAPNDKYEQEADRIADQVVRMPEPSVKHQVRPEKGEEETFQAKPIASQITPLIQRQMDSDEEEEEETLQTKEIPGHKPLATPQVQEQINAMRGNGQSLPKSVRSFYEQRFGVDFSNTRIHTGEYAAEITRSLNARAFTIGQDIFFNRQEFQPETDSGKHLLAHELVHKVQQQGNKGIPLSVQCKLKLDEKGTLTKLVLDQRNNTATFEVSTEDGKDDKVTVKFKKTVLQGGRIYTAQGTYGGFMIEESRSPLTVTFSKKAGNKIRSKVIFPLPKEFPVHVIGKDEKSKDITTGLGGDTSLTDQSEVPGIPEGIAGGEGTQIGAEGLLEGAGVIAEGEGESAAEQDKLAPSNKESQDESDKGKGVDSSTAKKLSVLITTPGSDVSENLTKAGEIENFKDMKRGEIKEHAVKRAIDTLSFCFGLAPSAAEALANTRKINILIPPLRKLRQMTADDSSSVLPIVADMGLLEKSFVDELGLSAGNLCEKKEEKCLFGETFCLPTLNFTVSDIKTARNIDTAIKATEAAVDAVDIFMGLGIFEAAEEGGEFLFKQWLRQQRKKGIKAKKLREAKRLFKEQKKLRKKVAKDPKSVRPSKLEGYDVEIKVGGHTYRRKPKPDGTWCRFTKKKCGIKFDKKLEQEINSRIKDRDYTTEVEEIFAEASQKGVDKPTRLTDTPEGDVSDLPSTTSRQAGVNLAESHHIATRYRQQFVKLLKSVDIHIDADINRILLEEHGQLRGWYRYNSRNRRYQHVTRGHHPEYHDWVLKNLRAAKGKKLPLDKARARVNNALKQMGEIVEKYPDILQYGIRIFDNDPSLIEISF